jgi:hypothetical protein
VVDVAFPDLPDTEAASLAQELISTRTMERVLVGEAWQKSFDAHVPQMCTEPSYMSERRKWFWSIWVFYELLFKELELEKSGFRPPISDSALVDEGPDLMSTRPGWRVGRRGAGLKR